MKKAISVIFILIGIAFLSACGKAEPITTTNNNPAESGIINSEPTNPSVDTDTESVAPDGSMTIKKPKLPKIPSGALVGNQENNAVPDEKNIKVEEDVKSILSEISEEENLNKDSGTTTP